MKNHEVEQRTIFLGMINTNEQLVGINTHDQNRNRKTNR